MMADWQALSMKLLDIKISNDYFEEMLIFMGDRHSKRVAEARLHQRCEHLQAAPSGIYQSESLRCRG